MLLGMYTIIALAFVSFFLSSNPMPIESHTDAIRLQSLYIPTRQYQRSPFLILSFRARARRSPWILKQPCLWRAHLYIFTIEIFLYLNPLSLPLRYIPLRHADPVR